MKQSTAIIWSLYAFAFFYFAFLNDSWSRGDQLAAFILFGWIPFAAMQWLWHRTGAISTAPSKTTDPLQPQSTLEKDLELRRLVEITGVDDREKHSLHSHWADRRLLLAQRRLDEFFERTGRSQAWYDDGEPQLAPNHPEFVEYYQLCGERFIAGVWTTYFDSYFEILVDLKHRLRDGASTKSIRSAYTRKLKSIHDQLLANQAEIAQILATNDLMATKTSWTSTINNRTMFKLAKAKVASGALELYPSAPESPQGSISSVG